MGYGSYGGMGDKLPLSFMEIESYMRITNTKLSHWEIFAIRRLSLEYIAQMQRKDEHETPPYIDTTEAEYLKRTAVNANTIAMKFGIALSK